MIVELASAFLFIVGAARTYEAFRDMARKG